jgi:cytochrome P450
MREHHPVVYHEAVNAFGVFSYEDVQRIFLDNENWSVKRRFDKLPEDQRNLHILANTVNGIDPPDHARLRMLAQPALSPRQVRELEPMVRRITAELLDEALPKGRFDLIQDLAHRLPQMVINAILGVPPEDYRLAKDLSDRMEAATGRYTGAPFTDPDALRQINREYREYFAPNIAERRGRDFGDVMSKLVRAEEAGDRLSNEELFKMAMIINRGGSETTMTGIAHMIRVMIEDPEQYRRVQEDRSLIPTAVEEVLRYYPPSHSMSRVAVRDLEFGGLRIPAGATVLLWLPAANRDPESFPDPDRFDVGRTPNRHLSFGYGIHMCIGMHLARLEMQTVLEQWLDRVEAFGRAEEGPIEWSETSLVAVFPRRFPVVVKSRSNA